MWQLTTSDTNVAMETPPIVESIYMVFTVRDNMVIWLCKKLGAEGSRFGNSDGHFLNFSLPMHASAVQFAFEKVQPCGCIALCGRERG